MAISEEERLRLQIEGWKTAVAVQEHFNDIELKIRGLAITVLTTVMGAAAVAIKDGTRIKIFGCGINLGAIVFFIGFVAWMLFYFVDQIWYHRLLMGAVFNGQDLEDLIAPTIPGIDLTHRISRESPHQITILFGRKNIGRPMRSKHKMKFFYFSIAMLLAVLVLVTGLGGIGDASSSKQPRSTTTVTTVRR